MSLLIFLYGHDCLKYGLTIIIVERRKTLT